MKMNRISKIILSVFLLVILIVGVSFVVSSGDDGSFNYDYAWTTAICDYSQNSCADYYVVCKNGEVLRSFRVTGFVTFSDSWQDPRGDGKKELCDFQR